MTLQIALSFVVWLVVGALVGRKVRNGKALAMARANAGCYAGLLFILSAVVLFAGLLWVARSTGPHPAQLSAGNWLAITGLGALFTYGQGEAAGMILRAFAVQPSVTPPHDDSSVSSAQSIPEHKP